MSRGILSDGILGQRKGAPPIGNWSGLIFKGSGFYITDYRSHGYKDAAKKDSGAAAPKTESKPAASAPAPKSDSKPSSAALSGSAGSVVRGTTQRGSFARTAALAYRIPSQMVEIQ